MHNPIDIGVWMLAKFGERVSNFSSRRYSRIDKYMQKNKRDIRATPRAGTAVPVFTSLRLNFDATLHITGLQGPNNACPKHDAQKGTLRTIV